MRALQSPVEHLCVEGQLTHSGNKSEFAGAHVQHNKHESLSVAVEEKLIPVPIVVIAEFEDLFLGCAGNQAADASKREIPDHLTGEGVPGSPDVKYADALPELHFDNLNHESLKELFTVHSSFHRRSLGTWGTRLPCPGAWFALSEGGPALRSVPANC